MAGVRKAANSHSSLHCCGCSCSLSGHMILWSRTHLQIGIYRTDNEGALLCTVRCRALRAELGSPRRRAKGAACNCAICHNSTKKRSASAPIRSVHCLTKGPANRRGLFVVQRPCGGYERDETLPLTQLWAKLRGKAYRNKSKNQHILADTLVFVGGERGI